VNDLDTADGAGQLSARLELALDDDAIPLDPLAGESPRSRADAFRTLLTIHDLWTAPLELIGGRERHQGHPAVAALKARLEAGFEAELDAAVDDGELRSTDAVAALRRIVRHRDDAVYDWLAEEASLDELVAFMAVEGGPDGGFDDLVATCQIGLRGAPKVVLGANYWDEMGRGDVDAVHTRLHDRLVEAVGLTRVERTHLPTEALERMALNGLLATNRRLQPEMLGALGLVELQAGARCRQVVRALIRTGAPADALPFYEEHAEADPRHAKEWLDGVIAPLTAERPEWAPRIVRGALWRREVDRRLFAVLTPDAAERAPTASTG
jgi:hypothetical protein